ncbi:Similar to PNPLA8: Calcium-independent phospholipase A2-gamma (Oryctolagus cuniculus) [Cotesia congregata]|uniref:Similar to PNPLA8: Calcium-independent phospholipase A2-gamma (Oryctolagus cuniculus) n=1 Tax=Cotesia congregata TaxID=51543 RepID=A0A8J2MNA0_COTCN|nr:Similar to PNPLA8: Calcium-independent phospholipase A2-gamma (Oryctolagus cuniculus) [Cotesia congregata]
MKIINAESGKIIYSILNRKMALHKNSKYCKQGVSSRRKLIESVTKRNDNNVTGKLSYSMNILTESKVKMQNQWKSFINSKSLLSIVKYNENFKLMLNKYWVDVTKKLTLSSNDYDEKRNFNNHNTVNNKDGDQKTEISQNEKQNMKELKSINQGAGDLNIVDKKQSLQSSVVASDQLLQNTRDQILALPQLLNNLFTKLNPRVKESLPLTTVPKWKTYTKSNVTKHSILSRTKHILNSIVIAESNTSQLKRIEDFLAHIEQYPEARYHALKEGVVKVLLRTRQKSEDEKVNESIREALAVIGYIEPLPCRGIRILSIDGGGLRGLLVIEMLKKLEKLTGRRVHEMFDYMCGVSTGAILAANLGSPKRKSLEEISDLYKALSMKIFNQNALRGTSSLVWSHAYYDTALWEKMLQEQLGNEDLIKTARDPCSPKFSAIATVFNDAHVAAYIFRNYTLPPRVESQYMGSYRHKLWESVRASAAAPTYFEEFKHGDYILSDGGIMVNNPCAVAIHEAKRLWPNSPIQCVVSFGTGRTPPIIPNNEGHIKEGNIGSSSWKDKFYKILASATDTEGVHIILNDLLPDHVYYRFNPYLTEMIPMDEVRPDKVALLEQDAQMYIRKNEDKFNQAAIALSQKKTASQAAMDWIKLQKDILGL